MLVCELQASSVRGRISIPLEAAIILAIAKVGVESILRSVLAAAHSRAALGALGSGLLKDGVDAINGTADIARSAARTLTAAFRTS